MPNPIPQKSRMLVMTREMGRCLRCGGPAPRGQWHHRRGRSVRDDHTHCTCNGVWLCATCHSWAHAHPFDARGTGFIVPRHVSDPGSIPVEAHYGSLLLECDGKFNYHEIHSVNGEQ